MCYSSNLVAIMVCSEIFNVMFCTYQLIITQKCVQGTMSRDFQHPVCNTYKAITILRWISSICIDFGTSMDNGHQPSPGGKANIKMYKILLTVFAWENSFNITFVMVFVATFVKILYRMTLALWYCQCFSSKHVFLAEQLQRWLLDQLWRHTFVFSLFLEWKISQLKKFKN